MDKLIYLNSLYDLYGELLTQKQQTYFEDYYFHNLSYGEIASKFNISRNAIYHQIKIIEDKLNFYEEKLNLYSKKKQISDIIELINDTRAREVIENIF